MFLKYYVVGDVQTNCYIAAADTSKSCVVIDPGDEAEYIMFEAAKLGYTIDAIIITHGHFDHILGVNDIKEKTGCRLYIPEAEKELCATPSLNCSIMHRGPYSCTADVYYKDNDIINEAGLSFKAIATPGHTIGSACLYVEDEAVLFSGDTLFNMSVGRTDLPTGSGRALCESVRNKLYVLPDNVTVYPGHGPETDIAFEKKNNMYV